MERLLLLFVGLFFSFQSFAQDPDPELFKTWYLHEITQDLGPTTQIASITPPINPVLEINADLTYTGTVCNEYGGFFSFDAGSDMLTVDFFDLCLCGACTNPPQSHVDLENEYFGYFYETAQYTYEILSDPSSNESVLILSLAPGFDLIYETIPALSVPENSLATVVIHPNPVSETLFITSEGIPIQNIIIYSLSGKKVMEVSENTNSIDVSSLSEGMYFLEIYSEEKRKVQKFIKQ